MAIYGVDIHPRFQAGINIEGIRREGFDFMAVKVSEGTDGSYLAVGSADFLRRARTVGLLCLGYHYLRAGNEDSQARVFVNALRTAGVPGMLDTEALASDGRTPALTTAGIRSFLRACQRLGAVVPLLYCPVGIGTGWGARRLLDCHRCGRRGTSARASRLRPHQ